MAIPSPVVRMLRDYTTLLVLLVLGLAVSLVTLKRQYPTGAAAGRQLAGILAGELPAGGNVLIVVGTSRDDADLAETLTERLAGGKIKVVQAVKGAPADAVKAIRQLAGDGTKIDAIACTDVTRKLEVFSMLAEKYPPLATAKIVQPRSYWWPSFLKLSNLLNIPNQIAVIAIVAIGMTMVIVAGGIDLSVGSLIALSAVLTARLIRDYAGGPAASAGAMVVCCLAAILICTAIGSFTGTLVAYVRIPPFIVTLALMSMLRGSAFIQSRGESIYQVPPSIKWLGAGADLANIPNAVVLMIVLYLIADVVMKRTTFGRHLYAVGGNARAAYLCGIPVRRVVLSTYMISAAFAGLGGVILASQFQSAAPTYAKDYELAVIAAVVVGGTSLTGGEGKIFGTLLGALIIAVVQNGMNLLSLRSETQQVVLGAVILLAALLDRLKQVRGRE